MSTTITPEGATALAAPGLTETLGLFVTLTLIALLIAREFASGAPPEAGSRWRRTLDVCVLPLAIVFAVIVVAVLADLH